MAKWLKNISYYTMPDKRSQQKSSSGILQRNIARFCRYFFVVCNKIIIPLTLVGYEMFIAIVSWLLSQIQCVTTFNLFTFFCADLIQSEVNWKLFSASDWMMTAQKDVN